MPIVANHAFMPIVVEAVSLEKYIKCHERAVDIANVITIYIYCSPCADIVLVEAPGALSVLCAED